MSTILESGVTEHARTLCQSVLDNPEFASARKKIETFMADDEAQSLYRSWHEMAQELHAKSHNGTQPDNEEIAAFESMRAKVMDNPVSADFAAAEEHLNGVFTTVTGMLQKTLQLGRMPTEADFEESGCCGGGNHGDGGCGCSH